MFTGIITDIGNILSVKKKENGKVFVIGTSYDMASVAIGSSIACAGVCLTVVEKDEGSFTVDVSDETLGRATINKWKKGTKVNLERSLKKDDELGGHVVMGHVDDTADVLETEELGENRKITFTAPKELAKFIAEKGSVTLDGVSLTVNGVKENNFWVNIIPHTLANTTLNNLKKGDEVNLEIDTVARYTARLLEAGNN